jgi:transcriptional regulator with XRE-family HTH domain
MPPRYRRPHPTTTPTNTEGPEPNRPAGRTDGSTRGHGRGAAPVLVTLTAAEEVWVVSRGAEGFDPSRLRRLRVSRGLTQAALGALVGTSQGRVGDWEQARNTPTARGVSRLAAALEVAPADLLHPVPSGRRLTLRQLREHAGLSQRDIAELLGLSQAAVTRIERGLLPLRADAITTLANAYNVSTDDITHAPTS